MQQQINYFYVLSISARIFGKFVSLIAEMAVMVSAVVDAADIVAIVGVAVCVL